MLKGFDKNGNVKDVLVTEEGAIKVVLESGGEAQQTVVTNTSENPVPVNIQNPNMLIGNTLANPVPVNVTNTNEVETTLSSSIQTIGTTAATIPINKKVTTIDIANYSATANLTVTVGTSQFVIAENIAISLPINKSVTNISMVSNEADTKVQVIVKGVE